LPQKGARGTKMDMKTKKGIFQLCDQVSEPVIVLCRLIWIFALFVLSCG
jgi:hypothetical protein